MHTYIHACIHTYIQLRVMCAPLMTAASATRTNKYNKHKDWRITLEKKAMQPRGSRKLFFDSSIAAWGQHYKFSCRDWSLLWSKRLYSAWLVAEMLGLRVQ